MSSPRASAGGAATPSSAAQNPSPSFPPVNSYNSSNNNFANTTASYTPDELAFHKLFPQVPLNEKLVENYQCGLSRKKIVRMGRLYVTSLRLCFHSTFLSENLMLEWENVDAVEKKENFVFEAIVIKTSAHDAHYFSAFMYGVTDQAHKMITMLWNVRKRYATSSSSALPVATVVHQRTDSVSSTTSCESSSQVAVSPQLMAVSNATDQRVAGGEERRHDDDVELPLNRADTQVQLGNSSLAALPPSSAIPAARGASPAPQPETTTTATTASPLMENAAVERLASPKRRDERAVTPTNNMSDGLATPENMSVALSPKVTNASETWRSNNNSQLAPPSVADAPSLTLGSVTQSVQPASNAAVRSPNDLGKTLSSSEGTLRVSGAASPVTEGQQQQQQQSSFETANKEPTSVSPPLAAAARPMSPAAPPAAPLTAVTTTAPPTTPISAPNKSEKRAERAVARASVVMDAPHDILKHFPNVPKSETVVDSFQCSYVVGVHRLGKLYITANYALFSSVMLSEGVCVKFSDIVSIEKEQTMVILDGVAITTKQGTVHNFTSFVNRDAAFSILQHFFTAHRSKNSSNRKEEAAAAAAAAAIVAAQPPPPPLTGGADTFGQDNKAAEEQVSGGSEKIPQASPTASTVVKKAVKPKVIKVNVDVNDPKNKFITATASPAFDQLPKCTSIDEFSKVKTDFGTGLSDVSNFLQKQIIPDVKFPHGVTVFDIFKQCFDDDTSLLDQYHEQRQDTARTWESWRPALEGSPAMSGQRKLLCTTIIRAVMAKACPFTEFQRFGLLNVNGSPHLLVQVSGQAVGVMFSDSFRAETLMVFSQVSMSRPEVTLKTFGYIQFLRSVWVRGKILSTALDVEMPECYRTLSSLAIARLQKSTRISFPTTEDAAASDNEEKESEEVAQPLPTAASEAPTITPPPTFSTTPEYNSSQQNTSSGLAAASPRREVPSSPMLRIPHMIMCALALLYVVQGIWTTLWLDRSAAVVSYIPSTAMPSADGTPLVMSMDFTWAVDLFRPLVMVMLLYMTMLLTSKLDTLLNAA